MSFVVYFFVLLVAASSVVFGLDWLTAPLPPMAVSAIRAPPPPAAKENQNAKLSPVYPAKPGVPSGGAAITVAPAAQTASAQSKCDINACTDAYYSFRASDCTYQPSNGPRRLCTKGNRPAVAVTAITARAQASCNVAACERAYRSFTASDCTYLPSNGPRRLCIK